MSFFIGNDYFLVDELRYVRNFGPAYVWLEGFMFTEE